MDNTIVVRLNFNSPLHFNKERDDMTDSDMILHSDALYAAIFHSWNILGYPEWIPAKHDTDFGFTVSSLLPFLKNEKNEPVYFFPRPNFANIRNEKIEDTSIRKKIKKSIWVDTGIFQKILNGEKIDSKTSDNFKGKFWTSNKLPETSLIKNQIVPRSMVSRFGEEDTKIFYIERYYFKDSGLYFLLHCENEEIQKRVISAISYLGDEGIGTDRNVGNGKFSIETNEWLFTKNDNTKNYMVNLGLYCPSSKDELDSITNNEKLGFDLIKRGGWLSEPYLGLRKKSIYMFKEGSCFLFSEKTHHSNTVVLGAMFDIRPEAPFIPHPVWRCGKSLFLAF